MEMCRIGAWSPLGALYGITQQIAADEICELAKSQIGFGQSAVSKIVKRSELSANALMRNAIKLWIEKQTESKAFVV
ncbi:uncharacterized protein OCT59_028461 [Rhizophagus irregularis]|uniref:uncharacterized protein n=1 Tax=Rhizophagus irregularis TaxID=588596 RepID=UPI003325A400|nr:hypothetical protein OCT59_025270 [Rhizophagus irregularis]UZO08199.1 hypothetical protein OCT59_028461 [Rhizophagus irregularis]